MMGGNGFRRADELNFVAHDVEHAAALEAGDFSCPEIHRHHTCRVHAWFDLDEIHMFDDIGDRMELQVFAAAPCTALPSSLMSTRRLRKRPALVFQRQFFERQRDRDRLWPLPYRMAGILPSRRSARAEPLPRH